MDTKTQQIQQDLAAYRAGKVNGISTPDTSGTSSAPILSPISKDLEAYRASKKNGTAPKREIPKDPNLLAEFAKGLFSAPATIVARPFQAAAELAGASAEDVNAGTKKIPILGDLVAPVPENFKDVKKDVGRAAESVALGTGAPIAGGALFGAGASLEQGNDLLSAQTAIDAALGGAGGKVLDWVGKPLLNVSGKVIGTITPQVIKDVAAGGAKAIAKFAEEHQLLGGIAAKPSEALSNGLQVVDEGISKGTKAVLGKTKQVAAEQFPGLNTTEHFKAVNERDLTLPTRTNQARYTKSTNVFNEAKARGIDLGKAATENGIQHDQITDGRVYNTKDTAENLRDANYKVSEELMRPIIREIQPGVRQIPIAEVRGAMLKRIHDIPSSQIDDTDRATLVKQIQRRYADNSANAAAHPNGYSLEDLHDNRIISGKNGGYRVGQSASDALSAQRAREEGRVFAHLFDRNLPQEAGLQGLRKELEKNFLLADYLEALHTKNIPEGITKKAIRLFGRAVGGTFGSKVGGFPGFLFGSQGGDMLFRTFETFPNPIKQAVLTKAFANRTQSPVFDSLRKYLGDKETERLLRKALPASGKSSFKETPPTLFTTPGGKSTPDKGEAIDVAAVETGRAKAPKSGRSRAATKKLIEAAQENNGPYIPPNELPVIKAGKIPKKPKRLNDIF